MSKLRYRTKKASFPFSSFESNMEHEGHGFEKNFPEPGVQAEAMNIVGAAMEKLLHELEPLGYDITRAGFFIHYKK